MRKIPTLGVGCALALLIFVGGSATAAESAPPAMPALAPAPAGQYQLDKSDRQLGAACESPWLFDLHDAIQPLRRAADV